MGHLSIILCIFSGRRNPECIIRDDDPEYQRIKEMLKTTQSRETHSVLGYNGFIVTDHSTFNATPLLIRSHSNKDLEMYLFDVCKFDSSLRPSTLKKHNAYEY